MDKTNVMVEFIITGDNLKPEIVTETIGISPSGEHRKGDNIIGRSSGCEESLDINDQLKKVINLLISKKNDLLLLKKTYGLYYKFGIVIRIEQNETPAVYLETDVIEFANNIKAEFDFDLYVY
jgi:hypothetical protein